MGTRVGLGFDIHPFVAARKLVLGGVEIPHARGLGGHSDADALLHAVCDAIYGALGAGDIGLHFPSSEAGWKDAPSSTFVEHAVSLLREVRGRVVNLDCVILAEEPVLAPHFGDIRARVAKLLGAPSSAVNVKAGSTERLGAIGRAEGVAAFAVVLVEVDESLLQGARAAESGARAERGGTRKRGGKLRHPEGLVHGGVVTIFIDGASLGNPGPSAWAAVVEADGRSEAHGEYLGFATNNQAEYHALIGALEYALTAFPSQTPIVIKCDSELVVKQMSGKYRVKDEDLKQLYSVARELAARFSALSIEHIPREKNAAADKHANRLISISI